MGSERAGEMVSKELTGFTFSTLKFISVIYIFVGFLHSLNLIFLSSNDCLIAEDRVSVYCNTGVGISHAVVVLGWPLLYF